MYRRFGPMVHRRCQRLLGDREEAADAMHDVFAQLVRRREQLTVKAPPSLLYKIATDVCLNHLRSRRRHPETRDEKLLAFLATTDAIDEQTEQRTLLDKIFQHEPASTRAIAVMHYVDKMTLQEVARAVNMSVSGVRKRLRTLQAHAAQLQGYGASLPEVTA
jgi:RNA polymerase sigma-70 factor (ECF subfamily)